MKKELFKREKKLNCLGSKSKKFSLIFGLSFSFFALGSLSAASQDSIKIGQKTSQSRPKSLVDKNNKKKLETEPMFLKDLFTGILGSFIANDITKAKNDYFGAEKKEAEINSKLDRILKILESQEIRSLETTEQEKLLARALVLRDSGKLLLQKIENLRDLLDEIESKVYTIKDPKLALEVMNFLSDMRFNLFFLKSDILDDLQEINFLILELL